MNKLHNFIHKHGSITNLAYKGWRGLYDIKEVVRPLAPVQYPNSDGVYKMTHLNIAITEICNAKCVFCVHHLLGEPTTIMGMEQFCEVLRKWDKFCPPHLTDSPINLTPSAPPGEPLTDPRFLDKMDSIEAWGYKAIFVTNGILLHKVIDRLVKFKGTRMAISFPSFNPEVYKDVYGVDRCEQVTRNIFALLEANKSESEPLEILIMFRNKEKPSEVMNHPNYKRLTTYFSNKVSAMFTTWWDTWNGGVKPEDMERGEIKVRKPLNLNRVCEGALSFSIRPTDRLIRLCGCRYVVGLSGKDDLVVGDLDSGFAAAQVRAAEIQGNFKKGIREKTCQNCGAYKQATS